MISNHVEKKSIKYDKEDYWKHSMDDIPLSTRLQMLSNHDGSIHKKPISEVPKEINFVHSSAKKFVVLESDQAASINTKRVYMKNGDDIARKKKAAKEFESKEEQFQGRVKLLESKEKQLEEGAKKLNSKRKQFESRVKEFESKEIKFEERAKGIRRKVRHFEGQVKGLESKEMILENRVKEFEAKENKFEVQAEKLNSRENCFEEQVKKHKFYEKQFKVQVKELESRKRQFEGQKKNVELKEKEFEGQLKEFEEQIRELKLKEMQFEGRVKEMELKEEKFEGRIKELELKENHFEVQVNEINSKEKQIEGKAKRLKYKEKHYEVQVKELGSKKRQFDGQLKDLDSKRIQILGQLKLLELQGKQCETLIKSFEEEKVADKQSSFTTDRRSKQLLTYMQTNKTEFLLNNDVLVILKSSSDPAKLVLDIIKNPLYPKCRKGCNVVTIEKSQIFLLEQLMRLSPHIKRHVRDEAKNLALDLEVNIRASSAENSALVLGFLLLLTIYGLVSCFHEDVVLNHLEFIALNKHAPEMFRTLGFVNSKVYDFVQNLIKKQKHIEAVGFICAYKLIEKYEPIDLLRKQVQNARLMCESICKETKSFEIKVKAIDEEIANLDSVLQCILDNKIECCDLHIEIQDRILELQSEANNSISNGIRACIQKCNNYETC